MPALTPNVDNVKLGACAVLYGADSLGVTKGGVDVTINTPTKEVTVDQFGPSIINEYMQGRTIEVKVPMAETDLKKLALAIPGSVLTIDGTDPTKAKLVVSNAQGTSLRAMALPLLLHPSHLDTAAKGEDILIPLAVPSGQMQFAYTFDNERVYTVTFKGYPDNTTGELFTMGDPAAAA